MINKEASLIIIVFYFRREDDLDVEVSASGFTRQMDKDLLVGMGIDENSSSEDDDDVYEDSLDEICDKGYYYFLIKTSL